MTGGPCWPCRRPRRARRRPPGPGRGERPRLRRRRARRRRPRRRAARPRVGPGPHRGRPAACSARSSRPRSTSLLHRHPRVVAASTPAPGRPTGTPHWDVELLVEQDGTLMGRWFVRRCRWTAVAARLSGSRRTRAARAPSAPSRSSTRGSAARCPSARSGRGRVVVPRAPRPDRSGTKSSPSEAMTSIGVPQLVGAGHPVGAGHVDRLVHPDEAPRPTRAHEVGRDPHERSRHPVQPSVVAQHDPQSMTGRVETPRRRRGRDSGRPVEGLQHDGAAHRPPEEEDAPGTVRHGIPHGRLDVAPLRQAEVVAAVGATRGVAVVAVGRDEAGPAGLAQHRDGAERLLLAGSATVDEHRPVATRRDPPRDGPASRAAGRRRT